MAPETITPHLIALRPQRHQDQRLQPAQGPQHVPPLAPHRQHPHARGEVDAVGAHAAEVATQAISHGQDLGVDSGVVFEPSTRNKAKIRIKLY